MPKNRDYTGFLRTPSSMAWLIRERATARGVLDRLQKLEKNLPEQIKAAQAKIDALDSVIPLHDVPVDPTAIKGTRVCADAELIIQRGMCRSLSYHLIFLLKGCGLWPFGELA
jgi:hypothetical protein